MCDYSLTHVKSRAAKVSDKLITKNFGTGTGGFAAVDDATTAICLLPGTEIAFDELPTSRSWHLFSGWKIKHKVAIFRQINKDVAMAHHDALEFPGGEIKLLTSLAEGRTATVLQLPAAPKSEAEAKDQTRLEVVG